MLLGPEMTSSLYAVDMGILLSPDLHKSFDALQWAFFPRLSREIVSDRVAQ
jgi:hypothetical protein